MKWISGTRAWVTIVAAGALTLSACSSEGGADEAEQAATGAQGMTFAMVTHAAPGDTFWDIIRKGADAAAEKNGVELEYSNSIDASKQATLIQNAIDREVDGLAVTIPNPGALNPVIQKAADAGIPVVAFNAGFDDWQDSGALMYFGQDEILAGREAGKRLRHEGAKKVLCVLQEQGQVQLESRCDGVKQGFGGTTEKLYVEGEDMTSVQSTIQAKLTEDPTITHVVTLAAPIALVASQSISAADSSAKLVTFDTNAQLVTALQDGRVEWAIDQQPYLQGYHAIDNLALYKTNRNILGGGQAVLTGPSFIDKSNVDAIAEYAKRGTR